MIRNEAPESMEGEYKVLVKGKSVTVTNTKTRETATARCHPDDKFDLGVGVNEAIEKINARRPIVVGDLVRIVDCGEAYVNYSSWVYKHVHGPNKCNYAYLQNPEDAESENTIYTVIAIAEHDVQKRNLAYIQVYSSDWSNDTCYLIAIDGLEKVVD